MSKPTSYDLSDLSYYIYNLSNMSHQNLPDLSHDNLSDLSHDNLSVLSHDNLSDLSHHNLSSVTAEDLSIYHPLLWVCADLACLLLTSVLHHVLMDTVRQFIDSR